jgi:hypothetical protein
MGVIRKGFGAEPGSAGPHNCHAPVTELAITEANEPFEPNSTLRSAAKAGQVCLGPTVISTHIWVYDQRTPR